MSTEDTKNTGHAARAAEGRTKWISEWKTAWDAADHAAAQAANAGNPPDPAEGRKQWALKLANARDMAPPQFSDAELNGKFVPAWNLAWHAAWEAAIVGAKVSLTERSKVELSGLKRWDRAGRIARAAAGMTAGCAAWNDVYRAEIKKDN